MTSHLTHNANDEEVAGRLYTREDGVIVAIHDVIGGASTFRYDVRGRLIESRGAHHEQFTYDAAGRLLECRDGSSGQALHGETAKRCQFNARDGLVRYAADAEASDASSWHYSHDALGRRVRKRGPTGSTTDFVWDGDRIVAEVAANGAPRLYIYPPDAQRTAERHALLAVLDSGQLHHCLTDHLGSVYALADDHGRITEHRRVAPYGLPRAEWPESTVCPFAYPGQYMDAESGLHYQRLRMYHPESGRYLAPDPLRIAGTMTLHDYAAGNPLGYYDADAAQPVPEPSKLTMARKLWDVKDTIDLTCQVGNHVYSEYRGARLENLDGTTGHNELEAAEARRMNMENCDREFAGNSAFPDMHGEGHGDRKRQQRCQTKAEAKFRATIERDVRATIETHRRLPPSPVRCELPGVP